MLRKATIQYELMAQNYWQLHLAKESNVTFKDTLEEDMKSK